MIDIAAVYACHLHFSKLSLAYFLDFLVINSSPRPQRWGAIREPWQDDLIRQKIPLFEALAFPEREYEGPWSFCDILPRGHDKTSLEARLVLWLLIASRRKIHGYILAADKDQGRLVLQAMIDEAALNPWVFDQLTFTRDGVSGPGGDIEVVPADAGSSYGYRGNLYIFDEWTNWTKPKAKDVWTAVYSGTEKIQPRIVGILSNAGYLGTWQDTAYQEIKKDRDFVCISLDGPKASWMPEERVSKLQAKLPKAEGRRVFRNQWIAAGEDNDYLSAEEIAACRDTSLTYRLRRKPLVANHVASIDYGPKRDRTVCTIGHQDAEGVTIVDRMDVFQGSPEDPVSTDVVWRWVQDVQTGFQPREYVIDPYGMNGIIEKMQARGLPVKEFTPRGGAANYELAQALRAAVASVNVRWYPGCGKLRDEDTLETELALLVTRLMSYGFRIDHLSNEHDDRAVSLGMLLCRTPEYPWITEHRVPVTPPKLGEDSKAMR